MSEANVPVDLEVIKGDGHDWDIRYHEHGETTTSSMTIFGVMSIEEAIKEARYSLGDNAYDIISVERSDADLLPKGLPAPSFNDAVAVLSQTRMLRGGHDD